ncbi:uncharacterized protein LOC111621797 [Centruroides sculpturatus]|uniref:uncharacterized protein LOC111621797 n=1 Tax=Centruroides sculpturatus TaxID=218467 RepID=UPI000C6D1D31|nr:uncharacterized protein LOC111621797 [Centruroides sculpturatus]
MVNDLTHLAHCMAPPRPTTRNHHRHQQQPRPQRQRNNQRPNTNHAADASRIQKLYRANKNKAFEEITRSPSRFCSINKTTIADHFISTNSHRHLPQEPLVASLPPSPLPTSNDPLCSIFTPAKRIGAIPSAWKTSTTILLHKKGDRDNITNWRPIALANTLGKLYSACIACRLLRWCEENDIISTAQKGFMRYDGCSEHNFILQSAIQDARRRNHGCHVAWLDLANAFGSVPHESIFTCLKWSGLSESFVQCIKDLLEDCCTRVRSNTGLTDSIPIHAGVKQGCPLSPILFNIVMEPALRLISNLDEGYRLHDHTISILAYADDITVVSKTTEGLQAQLNLLTSWAQNCGLCFNPAKCATLSVATKYQCAEGNRFTIQGGNIPHLKKGEFYQHLGIPTGFTLGRSAEAVIDRILADLKHVENSLLAPWQKIDCIGTFLTFRLTFHLLLGNVQKKALGKLDKTIKRCTKKWLYLPQRASPEIVHMPHAQGGANITPCGILADIAQVSHAVNLLHSRDPTDSDLAIKTLWLVVEKRIKRAPNDSDICTYLSGSMENEFGCDPYDIPSAWTRLRMATRRLRKRVKLEWQPGTDGTLTPFVNGRPITKSTTMKSIADAIKSSFLTTLLRKPDQGKAFCITATNSVSNHFLRDGNFTRFADWRFVHRARLSVVPLRGLRRFDNASQTCRRCQKHRETLAHVVNHCPPNLSMITKRHNAILDRLYNALNRKNLTVYCNQQIPDYPDTCRPDHVIINNNPKTATIIDIATPFENGEDAFERARAEKVAKYTDLAKYFRNLGYETFLNAFIVGALGGYDAANECVLQRLGITRNYSKLMRRLIVSDCIRWSRDIYTSHLGSRYRN